MNEEEAEALVLRALLEVRQEQRRDMLLMNTSVYGFQGKLLNLLRAGKVSEAIAILEEGRKVYEDKVLNR